jgi:hypothetical protein
MLDSMFEGWRGIDQCVGARTGSVAALPKERELHKAKCRKVTEPLGDRGTFRIFASQIEPAGSATAAGVDKPTHERRRDSRPRADLATNRGT